ncbi:androgen dependent TFPI regulating protein 1 isoform X2 [Scleropages formosus]|uniref:androgen dependent TFPI regulating protein 1 isoform X2 n=1 Tax=Scleropages formosus TaxID=113540 RepID=UPI000878133A|nr:androgen-dependent TFPI-regulating protein-like isoform X2 [Scleropages formosus]
MAARAVSPKCRGLIHFAVFLWYCFILNANCSPELTKTHPGVRSYGGRWKYLTFLNMFFSGPGKLTTLLVNIRDFLFTILAFPLGTFVCISFWTLYVIDRKLVYPKYLDDIIPLWLNHAMHTAILLLVLLELYLQPHRYPRRIRAVLCLALFCAAYLAWVLWVHHVSEIWVYPIMAHLSPAGLALFLAASALALLPLYLLGEKLSLKYWTKPGTQKKKKK